MFTLFSRIILSNWRSLLLLSVVILFASTGFITLRQITTNIESLVARETRPLFGADIIISPRGYASGDILPLIETTLSKEAYVVAERREFSTTLLDHEGKVGLVQVVAYSGSYPQRGILEVEGVKNEEGKMKNMEQGQKTGDSEIHSEGQDRVAITPGLIEKFASGGSITLDGRNIPITKKIIESSDLGFSLGTDNHLIILPSALLSGSILLSSGSRLDHDLYISFQDEKRANVVAQTLRNILPENLYRVRTYEERTNRNLDTVETLTDYITLILLVASIFAFILLRSAHESFFENLAHTLRVSEILGLTQRRQKLLLLMLYGRLFPLAFFVSVGIADIVLEFLRMIPEAEEFQFFWMAVPYAFIFLSMIVIMAWFPVWWRLGRGEENVEKVEKNDSTNGKYQVFLSSRTGSGIRVSMKEGQDSETSSEGQEQRSTGFSHTQEGQEQTEQILPSSVGQRQWRYKIISFIEMTSLTSLEVLVPFLLGIFVLILLFQSPLFALSVAVGVGVFYFVFASSIRGLYHLIFARSGILRKKKFYLYDALRSLVRPITPTIPITISLVSVTIFFMVFASFSLAFRSKLIIDASNTANIFAINILEKDKESIKKIIGPNAFFYDILRARIERVNNRTLQEHFSQERPSGEFTREFNITTTKLENKIFKGKNTIGKGEVSIDDDFANRLNVDIGDSITFLLSGREITLNIANIRESVREGFRPFFYFSFDPIEFANAPRTYFVAEYTSDTEQWKRDILSASGPHVTFIDVENILKIARDISTKVLGVIGLFFVVVMLFAVGAIIAFFTRMKPIENIKRRLYNLFGARTGDISTSLLSTRASIFIVSYILSIIIGGILSYGVLSFSQFFTFSLSDFLMIAGVTGVAYMVMMVGMHR